MGTRLYKEKPCVDHCVKVPTALGHVTGMSLTVKMKIHANGNFTCADHLPQIVD